MLSQKLSLIKSMDYSKTRVQTSITGSGVEDAAILLADAQKELLDAIRDYHYELVKRIKQIDDLPDDRHQVILYARFVEGKSLEEISCEIGLSYYWACHELGQALQQFGIKYGLGGDSTNEKPCEERDHAEPVRRD